MKTVNTQKRKSTRTGAVTKKPNTKSTNQKSTNQRTTNQKKTYKKSASTKGKNTSLKNKQAPKSHHEIKGVLLLAFGVLVLLSFYFKNSIGVFGDFIRNLLLGLSGAPAFAVPPVIIVYAFLMIFKKNIRKVKIRAFFTFVLFLLVCAFIQTAFYQQADFENLSFSDSISKMFENGKSLLGGGVLGGLISMPFLSVFKTLGTIVILTAFSIVDIILLTNMSVANFIRNMRSIFVKGYQAGRLKMNDMREMDDEEEEEAEENEMVHEDENLRLQFKVKPKVIDFKIEKTSRELKENLKHSTQKTEKLQAQPLVFNDQEEEDPFEVQPEMLYELQPEIPCEIQPEELPVYTDEMGNIEEVYDNDEIDDIRDIEDESNEPIHPQGIDTEKSIKKDALETLSIDPLAPVLHEKIVNEYRYPSLSFLDADVSGKKNSKAFKTVATEGAKKLEDTLASFGVAAKVINVSQGPSVTRYELQPSVGVKVSKIVNLSDDISLNMAAAGVRIEAPIPGKAAIGIEIANKEVTPVFIKEVLESEEFQKNASKLSVALGKDVTGQTIIADVAKMPHMLIAGATGSGKSVCVNNLIVSILYKASPDEVKLLMIDPKVVELGIYNGIPHLLIPVVTDPRKAAGALNWAVQEMINRYKLFAEKGARDMASYNKILKQAGEEGVFPHIVIIIDELADLMMAAPNDVEDAICRLAQMARAAGMHLVIATQRPSVDVITGVIKANIPSRISFAVSSQVDSRTILDMAGAEKLLGKGDMLFYPIGIPKPIRVQGAYVSDKEIERVVEFVKNQGAVEYNDRIIDEINSEKEVEEGNTGDNDALLPRAIELVVEAGMASVSLIQRKFKVGYARAARIVDQMEARGIVGKFEGSKPRQVLITKLQLQEMQMSGKEREG